LLQHLESPDGEIHGTCQHSGIATCENKALSMPLSFDPGERWEYGINIDWAGKAVEAVSGKKLDAYLREHVFAPLAMNSTSFRLTADMRTRLVGMHQRAADGTLAPVPFEMAQEPEFRMGGGGLYSTAPDYIASSACCSMAARSTATACSEATPSS
jgi:methyl acetate hydrolase